MMPYMVLSSMALIVWGLIMVDWIRVGFGATIFLSCFLIYQMKLRRGGS
jgi:hypothetical protein